MRRRRATPRVAPTSRSFRDLDVNADGALSKDEALADAQLAKHFDKADKNGDGNLSEVEYDTSHHRSSDSKY
ncbi:hypothetical protein ACFOLC_08315 [Lysobacter cavernae]|uniref:EF-hand domain-containing protein n=1 Tax=Lysobacter cavernae TaxID=1685901 RepID=A0ABV7RT56_9GAMM